MRELPITGYLDRLSARPAETLEAKVGVREGGRYRARLVRVLSADPNPEGPGVRFEDLSQLFDERHDGRRQPIALGSWGEAPGPDLAGAAACWTALILPTLASPAPRVVLHHAGSDATLTLAAGQDGVHATLSRDNTTVVAHAAGTLAVGRWYRVWASLDPAGGRLVAGVSAAPRLYAPALHLTGEATASGPLPSGGTLRIAVAEPGRAKTTFTGKIEDPAVLRRFRADWQDPLATFDDLADTLVAGWDFSKGISGVTLAGVADAHQGMLHNMPLRAVTGARWTGAEHCWRHAPDHYRAIKFQEDDLGDCGWTTDFAFRVPDALYSGSYALHLSCAEGEDWLPFYVLPPRDGVPRARAVFLASTLTYQAYGNHARRNADEAYRARVAAWGAYPYNPDDYPIYGRSTYNLHSDNAGVALATRLRPLLTMRPGFVTFVDPNGSGLRHYPADSHLIAWAEACGIDLDIVTDEDLDAEGAVLLAPYKVVLTGSHPEYHTAAMLDAIETYVREGGRFCYLGGNGFYWRVGRSPDRPDMVELRRAENGVRAWPAAPGEYHHALDGEYGGLWRNNGRPPQQVALTGFSAQGAYEAGWFRRTPESYHPSLSWIFDGVEGETFGDYGLSAGGAAGFELDRADPALGTPAEAVVVARSDGLPPSFGPLMEEMSFPPKTFLQENAGFLVRGDMTIFETAKGGGIFAASSITFCGSLWRDGAFQGPVSTILENVVRRFSRD